MKNGLDFRLSGRKRGIRQFDWLNFRFLTGKGKERWQRRLPYYITEKEAVSSGSDRSRKNDIYFVSVGKSDRRGAGRKDFYLTAKTITRTVAEQAFRILGEQGLQMKVITLTAKEKICKCEETECNPVSCPYAKGHFDRVNDAVYDLIMNYNEITRRRD